MARLWFALFAQPTKLGWANKLASVSKNSLACQMPDEKQKFFLSLAYLRVERRNKIGALFFFAEFKGNLIQLLTLLNFLSSINVGLMLLCNALIHGSLICGLSWCDNPSMEAYKPRSRLNAFMQVQSTMAFSTSNVFMLVGIFYISPEGSFFGDEAISSLFL